MRIIWRMSFFESLAKRLCAFVILAVIAPPVWSANPLPQNRESDSTMIFGQATPRTSSHLALDSDDASPLLAQAETSSDSSKEDALFEEAKKLWEQGDYTAALPLFKRALAINEKTLGAQHPDTVTSLHNLAVVYYSQGDYAVALPLYKRALAIREKTLGAQHPDTALSLNALAELYRVQGDYAAAEPLHKRALAIREKTLGAQHPDTANSLNNLAGLHESQGDYAAAEPLYKRALAIREKTLGAATPRYGVISQRFGVALLFARRLRRRRTSP